MEPALIPVSARCQIRVSRRDLSRQVAGRAGSKECNVRFRSFVLVGAVGLAGCGMIDPQDGYRPMSAQSASQPSGSAPERLSFNQANAQCWTIAYSLLGGNAMDMARDRAYNQCMNDRGWENPALPARPQPTTTPGSR
jgi:hypothetical protein